MLLGWGFQPSWALALYFVTTLWVAILVMTLMGFSTILFVPAQQAFLGDNVPYAQTRARDGDCRICLVAGCDRRTAAGRNPRADAGMASRFCRDRCLCRWSRWRLFGLRCQRRSECRTTCARAIGGSYREALRAPMAVAVISTIDLLAAANENMYIVFGAWMNSSFGLGCGRAWDWSVLRLVSRNLRVNFASRHLWIGSANGEWWQAGLSAAGSPIFVLAVSRVKRIFGHTVGLLLVFFMFELAIVAALAA